MRRLVIVLLIAWAIVVAGSETGPGKGKGFGSPGSGMGKGSTGGSSTGRPTDLFRQQAQDHASMLVNLAAGGDSAVGVAKATNDAQAAAMIASQGDSLSLAHVMGGWVNRRLRGEASAESEAAAESEDGRIRHSADMISGFALDTTQPAIQAAAGGGYSVRKAAGKGHLAAAHATVGDSYDFFKIRSGWDRRRLGERPVRFTRLHGPAGPAAGAEARRLGEDVRPDLMSTFTGFMVKDAVMAAADGRGSAKYAANMGREAATMNAVDRHYDSLWHASQDEVPEGRLTMTEDTQAIDQMSSKQAANKLPGWWSWGRKMLMK